VIPVSLALVATVALVDAAVVFGGFWRGVLRPTRRRA
jgi:hypothetical protein